MPSSLKRKKPDGGSGSKRVDAAPEAESTEDAALIRPDLLETLASNFPGATRKAEASEQPVSKKQAITKNATSDYEKFMQEIGDIL